MEWLKHNVERESEVYFCGPVPFMKDMYQNLRKMGIPDERIHFEMFQSGVAIRK